ncbi:MAG: GH36-type glycosyl hydrolase domain-containing protein [Clostridia bacterium]
MKYKSLIIKGAILSQNQLETYLEKVASDHSLQNYSNKNTYPIPRLKENFEVITQVYQLLNEHIKLGIPIHPAGEWILDNYYVIDESVKFIKSQLSKSKYINFLGIANGTYSGFARIYVLAAEIVNYTDNKINGESLAELLQAYQRKKTLSMEEIWNINIFLQICLIENIREICEKIYNSQIQKYKVENIIERLVEQKNKEELQFTNVEKYKEKIQQFGEMKYPFIEYLSYKLKKYGKKAYPYINILEEQVNKMGTDISEVIKKEHYDIALRKISMGNCITSIKNLNRISMAEIFENINGVEDILKKDPINVYDKMDYQTKVIYRNAIKEISKKTKVSEIYIAKKVWNLANKAKNEENIQTVDDKKMHVGYYLISNGKNELLKELTGKEKKITSNNQKIGTSIIALIIITIAISTIFATYFYKQVNLKLFSILLGILLLIPIQSIVVQITQYILGKSIKPKHIPKLDFFDGVPKEAATFVVIPTILNSKEKVKKLMSNLEVYYNANKSENIYFALLGDCTSGKNEKESFDEQVIKEGIKQANKLNKEYPDSNFPKFHFLYRKRIWNSKEQSYLGWERKRGLLNQFNEYLLGKEKDQFLVNTIEMAKLGLEFNFEQNKTINSQEKRKIPEIKYVITLDADTKLTLNTGLEMIGAMAHILNKPVLNNKKDLVIDGHALMQPRVGISLLEVQKSNFTKIYAGSGGTDAYTNAISDIYQDNFEEGIFTGKGIYDVAVFSTVLASEIPENTVLSHDLLEGCYLRCGLISDVLLLDGYPMAYNSFKARLHRWIRGDWQLIGWLKNTIINKKGEKKQNPLTLLSKYKIFDNLIRSLQEATIMLSIIYISIFDLIYKIKIAPIITLLIVSAIIPSILEILNRILLKKDQESAQKTYTKTIAGVKASLTRAFLTLASLPDKAYFSLNACIKTLYRIFVSQKHFLEWMTAEEAEKNAKKDLLSYYKNMLPNVVAGILGLVLLCITPTSIYNIFIFLLSILWIVAPAVFWYISKEIKITKSVERLTQQEKDYLLNLGKKTWQYFKECISEKSNFLPPDNYQEDRKPKIMNRTSPTNIGLGLLAVISSYDLEYENLEETIKLLEKMLNTINNLPKWNGHLYNWYNLENLQPLMPRYISTVDSGNLVGYLFTVKQFLNEQKNKLKEEKELLNIIENLLMIVEQLINNTDFSKLYDENSRLFSIGFNIEENSLTDSYYDLLASEARQASLIAIAKKDVPAKHWNSLSRTLTILNKYKGLISWSGTAFEYFMPNINIPKYPGSLLDESCKFMFMSQTEYAKKLNIPWGISESAFNLKDLHNNYQYKAFGIPWLGLKRGLSDEMVVSSYGSVLMLADEPKEVIKNLKELEKCGMYQKYGFYESIDYTPTRLKKSQEYAVVKTYMAHHQGLILLSINNLFKDNILQKRFMQNPQIQAVDILLQERMPENVIITKEKKEKIEKIKYVGEDSYSQKEITKISTKLPQLNCLSSNNYTIITNSRGQGYSKYGDIIINRYNKTQETDQGILFFFKNVKSKRIWSSGSLSYLSSGDKYTMYFTPDQNKIVRQDGNIETITKTTIAADSPVELRTIELTNYGLESETIEITSFIEPVLSTMEQDNSHPSFNNLFLNYEYLEETKSILVYRRVKNEREKQIFLGVNLYTENEVIGELEYEIDKEKFYKRNELGLPKMVKNSIPFSNQIQLTIDPIIALKRTVKINPQEKVTLNLIIAVGKNKEQVKEELEKFTNQATIKHHFELSRAKVEAENRYLGVTGKQFELYQQILGYLVAQNPLKKLQAIQVIDAPVSKLWQYGISGDLPILLLKIQNIEEIEIVKEILKAYNYLRVKNIEIDLVIINQEKYSYEGAVKEAIFNSILNENLSYLQNIKGGIFVLENLSNEEINFFEYRSNLSIDAAYGNIYRYLKELEEEYIDQVKEMPLESQPKLIEETPPIREKLTNLKYFNEYGGFSQDGKEYYIRVNKDEKLPTVWSHIIANEKFGTLLTESMGGYTWCKNSRLNRLTSWNNSPVTDVPSEIIYLQDKETKKIWSLGLSPSPDENDYYITYGLGYAKYNHNSCGIQQQLDVFVPKEQPLKIQILNLKNNDVKKRKIKLIYYIKPVLGEDEVKSSGYYDLHFISNSNLVYVKNTVAENNFPKYCFISSSEKITSYTGSKEAFLGKGNLGNPDAIHQVELNNQNSLWQEGIIAIQCEVELEALESKNIIFMLGETENLLDCQDLAYKYTNYSKAIEEYNKVKKYWQETTESLQVSTPIESINILLNGWILYQVISSRIWGKTGYHQSGGAFGFRDQLQDVISVKYVNPEMMKNQIIKHSKHQFIEGDALHWWHEETKRGIRTRFSDDRLWLVYLVEEYILFTGDKSILEIQTPYLVGDVLEQGVDEKYDLYNQSEITETIYQHCKKAINISLEFGENGLPKIGSGDWNDGFSKVGNLGKGESVWLGFFLYDILKKFIPICIEKGENQVAKQYEEITEKLKKALNNIGWDGRWFRRAFMDDGNILGSIQNQECRIDSIAQSWSVISGAGDNDKKYICMESLENHLVDKENGIIKLLDPPFDKGILKPGYISSYLPGTRENGGQYTHSAIWAIIAFALLGFGDKAVEYYKMINPIEHCRTKEATNKYKGEPYVISADVYGQKNLAGRCGWTWYTGSASWMYEAGIKYLLGLRIENNILSIKPSIPSDWKEYSIKYKYGNSIYHIEIKNPNGKSNTVESFKLNGEEVKEKQVLLNGNGGIYNIEILM